MLIDRPKIVEGSVIVNATVSSGPAFPALPNTGELFYLTAVSALSQPGFFAYSNAGWVSIFVQGAQSPGDHISDPTVHITVAQNALLDGLDPLLTSAELNFVHGITSPIQAHIIDDARHLTPEENILLDSTVINGITAPDIAKLSGAAGLASSITSILNTLSAEKISRDGSISMSGDLAMSGHSISNVASPVNPTDVARKDYVDNLVNGMRWFDPARVASISSIDLGAGGLLTIDGVTVSISDRVLVKDQAVPSQNGIYLAATSAWSRAPDYSTPSEISTSALYVSEGTSQQKTSWIQFKTIVTLGTDPINFSPLSGPVVNTAGPGIVLGISGTVSIKEGAGLTFDGSGALVSDVFSTGGLMVTTDNVNPATLTTASAQLALTNTGVLAGTYNNVSTAITPFTVDAKGRIISVGSAIPIVSSFSGLTGIPSTIAGYGITDAVKKTGDTMTGSLLFSGGTAISGTAPSASSAYVSTGAYGISQGDNRTHFGFLTGGAYVNYIRGSDTIVNGTLHGDALYDATFRVLTTNTVGSYAPTLSGIGASGTWGINVIGSASSAASATLAAKASTLAQGGANGSPMTFNWAGQAGQPSWLWGSNDGSTTNVYNPANFSVSYAGTATYLSATQQINDITGAQASMAMTAGGGSQGSFTAKASGAGDANLAGMTFWNDSYAIKLGVRADGYFGLGGWSRSPWSWYSDPSGNMVAAGNVAAYSDPRLKENITPILGAVSIIQQMNGVRFSWKYGYPHIEVKAGKQDIGVLANEVQAVLPEIVTESIEIEGQRYKTVAYDKIVPVLIEAIKELKTEIELLKTKVS